MKCMKNYISGIRRLRARANWLKHGDRNTSFFLNYASKRKRKNTIKGLADHNRTIQEDGATMCSIVQDYFGNLFTSELGEPDPAVLTDVQHCVT